MKNKFNKFKVGDIVMTIRDDDVIPAGLVIEIERLGFTSGGRAGYYTKSHKQHKTLFYEEDVLILANATQVERYKEVGSFIDKTVGSVIHPDTFNVLNMLHFNKWGNGY